MTDPVVALDVDLDGLPWVIGPTPARPFEIWLPEVVALMSEVLDVGRRQRRERRYLTRMLGRIGQPDDGPLPCKLIRWLDLRELPLVASVGLLGRGGPELAEAFLVAEDSGPVERPLVEELPAVDGAVVRRSVAYSQPDTGIMVEARCVVDDGHPAAVALVHAGDRDPAAVVDALDDLDAVAVRLRVTGGAR